MKNKKSNSVKETWKHVGGGCSLRGNEIYPCDDIYMNVKTKKEFTVFSCKEVHFKMPEIVSGIAEVLKIKGVSKKQI